MRIAPHEPAGKPPRIGIEQQLVGVKSMALLGRVRTVHAITVELSWRNVGQVTMPDIFAALEFAAALGVEQTELDLLSIGGEQREIGAPAVPACAEARGRAGRKSHDQCPLSEVRK